MTDGRGKQIDRIAARDSNLELYRIIAMLMIVARHYVGNSGLTAAGGPIIADPLSMRSTYLLLLGSWGKTGINCFVLITGYFMCRSQIRTDKFVRLLLEVMFYRVVIQTVFWITGYEAFNWHDMFWMLVPVTRVANNFTGSFLVFYLCIPFLNILVRNLNEKQHIKLLCLCGFIYVFMGTVPGFEVKMNYVSWFIVIYFIASYIRMYPKAVYDRTAFWGWLTLLSFGLSAISVIGLTRYAGAYDTDVTYSLVTDSNALLAVTNGITSFMLFRNLKVKHSRVINTIAASTFGVLLIHAASDTMRRWLWTDVVDCVGHYYSPHLIAYSIGSILIIYASCTCIDIIRRQLLEVPLFRWWEKKKEKA